MSQGHPEAHPFLVDKSDGDADHPEAHMKLIPHASIGLEALWLFKSQGVHAVEDAHMTAKELVQIAIRTARTAMPI